MRAISLALVLFVACAMPAAAQTPWETVTSKEGQFTVDMPGKPTINKTRTRKGPSGTIKILVIGCKAQGAVYFAEKVDFPTAIVKGTEEMELNYERDDLAEQWNGKVINEKKVRADNRIGRDFTIRGKPIEEEGVVTIRVREYLDARSIYLVAVVSAPNRELPEDVGRFLGSLTLGAAGVRATGKPEPEPTGKDLPGWGLAIDPAKDCEFRPDAKTLSIQVPGTWHDLNPESGKINAPRVVRTVEGDFTVTVKVAGEFKPGGKGTNPKSFPYNGGGIVIWNDSDNFIRLERGAMLRNKGKLATIVMFEEREGGYRGALHNEVAPAGDCFLRVERKGSRIAGLISFDGARWKQLQPIDTLWPSKLKVGLSAINSNNEPFSLRFEEFTLKGKEAK